MLLVLLHAGIGAGHGGRGRSIAIAARQRAILVLFGFEEKSHDGSGAARRRAKKRPNACAALSSDLSVGSSRAVGRNGRRWSRAVREVRDGMARSTMVKNRNRRVLVAGRTGRGHNGRW